MPLTPSLAREGSQMPAAESSDINGNEINALGSQIVREIVIPELTKEVNEDKNFAQLRQVYNSLILATWYKKKIKDSILAQVYADKNKIARYFANQGTCSNPNNKERVPKQVAKQRSIECESTPGKRPSRCRTHLSALPPSL